MTNLKNHIGKDKIKSKINELEADLSNNPNYGWLKRNGIRNQINILEKLLEEN